MSVSSAGNLIRSRLIGLYFSVKALYIMRNTSLYLTQIDKIIKILKKKAQQAESQYYI